MNWLDLQTQEMLQAEPPMKLAPPKVAEYGVVLLQKGIEQQRLVRAVMRINDCSDLEARTLLRGSTPLTINTDLEYGDAQIAQFELICCDAAAAILSSEVLEQGDRDYLAFLFGRVCLSPEFKPCTVTIVDIPNSVHGCKFADQFLGIDEHQLQELSFPFRADVPLKKARIMTHWARQIGVMMECEFPLN